MQVRKLRPNMAMALIAFTVLFSVMLLCARAIQKDNSAYLSLSGQALARLSTPVAGEVAAAAGEVQLDQSDLNQNSVLDLGPVQSPTPDEPHPLPPIRQEAQQYTMQAGDALGELAKRFGISLQSLLAANTIPNPDVVPVGTLLTIPAPEPGGSGPDFKIIPDSELVFGPAAGAFDVAAFIQTQGGYLAVHEEEVDGVMTNGAGIIQRIAYDYSVNPRLLLAVLEYQSGWVTQADPNLMPKNFPIGLRDQNRKGLYRQLAWTANQLNAGFYVWRVNGASTWVLSDGSVIPIASTINAGTAGVQSFFTSLYDRAGWMAAVTEGGLFSTYARLFGYPFHLAVEPLLPAGLSQPFLQLPFRPGELWAYTGGPHGGWGDGSAWAALDFAPPGEALGCVQSDAWIVAAADGQIVRTGNGAVVQDLDGDGNEGTGWTLLYMHIETRDRVQPGTYVKAGEPIGHPSCEGGVSTGTHIHFARRYNGEWIPADQPDLAFNLDGWVSSGDGYQYDGYLVRDGQTIEAYAGRSPGNGIGR